MISWHRDLESACTAGEVLQTTRDFLATFDSDERACLPEMFCPRDIATVDDIREWSRRLTDEFWRQRNAGGELAPLQEMWSFFLRASIQLARIDAAARERVYGREAVAA
jgi:hypothetical protein